MSATDLFQDLPDFANDNNTFQEVISFSAGSIIFEEDEKGYEAYLIQEGYVEISKYIDNKKTVIALLGPGELFGEISTLDGQKRSATATALHEISVLPISRSQFNRAISSEAPLTQLLLQSLIRRLRNMHILQQNGEKNLINDLDRKDKNYMEAQSRAIDHLNSLSLLSDAVNKNQFQLNYQPIVHTGSGIVNGFEVLVRGPKDMPEYFSPFTFISMMEESGMIVPLGEWILEYGLKSFKLLYKQANRFSEEQSLFISINVSPRQLEKPSNVERLVNIVKNSDVPTDLIKLEITESSLLGNPQAALGAINRLRATGLSISIDDFGTGYSSLNYLNRFPLKTLKIDRSFIKNLFTEDSSCKIVEAIINMAHILGMTVVAEGIETKEDHEWIRDKGCEYGQGYYYAKPMSFNDAINSLRDMNAIK